MAQESDTAFFSADSEEVDDLKCSIPGLRFLRETAVEAWAVEEPEEEVEQDDEQADEPLAEEVPVAPAPREQEIPRITPYHRYVDAEVDRREDEESPEEGEVDSASPRSVRESTYDEQGLLTLREEFESGRLLLRKRFAYRPDGKLLRKVVDDPVNETLETEERTYGANDKIARKVITYSDGSRLTTEHRWDGDREEEITSSEEGIESHVIRTHDAKDRVTERVDIDPQSREKRCVFNTYDAQDRFVESVVIEPDGSRWVSARAEYDADGNEKSIVSLDADGNEIQRTVYAYRGGDCIREITTDSDGELRTENVFDGAHHCIRSTKTGPGVARESIFEYDERGLQTATAARSMDDRGLRRGRGSIEARVRTIWQEYEFYPSAEATSI
jgi:hypothetical protein